MNDSTILNKLSTIVGAEVRHLVEIVTKKTIRSIGEDLSKLATQYYLEETLLRCAIEQLCLSWNKSKIWNARDAARVQLILQSGVVDLTVRPDFAVCFAQSLGALKSHGI